ncbi:MAG: transposase [Pseudomonadota bacterium]
MPRSDRRDHGRPIRQGDRKGGIRGFDGHTRVKGQKRQILVEIQGVLVACRVEPVGMSDRKAARNLTAGLPALWPNIHSVFAVARYESKSLTQHLRETNDLRLIIVKRKERAFRIVERPFGWLGRHRRLSKDDEYQVQTSETLITIAACAQFPRRLAPK